MLSKDISFLADDLITKLNSELSSKLKIIGGMIVEDVHKHIDSDVYGVYPNPKVYERTGKLKESIKMSPVDNGINGISIDIYSDDEIAKGHHMYESNNKVEPYAGIVESGIGYDYGSWNGHPWDYQVLKRPFMRNTIEENSDNIVSLLDKAVGDAIKKL